MLCLARIKSAFEMNNIQRGHLTCYMEDISLLRSFGEGQVAILLILQSARVLANHSVRNATNSGVDAAIPAGSCQPGRILLVTLSHLIGKHTSKKMTVD
jgi:hypothetical protein